MTPLTIRQKITNESIGVPCGKCPDCIKRRQSAWSFRLMQEEKASTSAYFLTLTYETSTVPITRNGFMSLDKRDMQLFMKRLRKSHPKTTKLKYYLVGEYGGKTKRPHYHIILFNAQVELIQSAWTKGQIHYGQVTGASVGYTLKYMMKSGPRIPAHQNDDRSMQFGLMSKGLGLSYVTEQMLRWHHADKHNRMFINIDGGKKIAMPRYFKEKIYNEHERKSIGISTRIAQIQREEKRKEEYGDQYERDKAEAVKAAFERLPKSQSDGTSL